MESERLKGQGAGQDKDPQVSIISRLFKLEESHVRNALVIFAALLVEIGSGVGLFLATGHSEARAPSTRTRERPQRQMNQAQESVEELHPVGVAPFVPAQAEPQQIEMEQRRVGEIEDFWLESIGPDPAGGMELPELFSHYQRWCADNNFDAAKQGVFAQDFERVAKEIGIRKNGAVYVGLKMVSEQLALAG